MGIVSSMIKAFFILFSLLGAFIFVLEKGATYGTALFTYLMIGYVLGKIK